MLVEDGDTAKFFLTLKNKKSEDHQPLGTAYGKASLFDYYRNLYSYEVEAYERLQRISKGKAFLRSLLIFI